MLTEGQNHNADLDGKLCGPHRELLVRYSGSWEI